jgi:4-alpha-glucanotransferase
MNPSARLSGVLLPLFSLRARSDFGIGDFGSVDGLFAWLQQSGQRLWMMLPLLPTAWGDPSPYSTCCAFGLNPLFIDLNPLIARYGLTLTEAEKESLSVARRAPVVRYDLVVPLKAALLARAFDAFEKNPDAAFETFCAAKRAWLDDYALFAAISEEEHRRPWWDWKDGLAERAPLALQAARTRLKRGVRFQQWAQWMADTQWQQVRKSATAHGVLVCGDEPFIIGQNSSDCWCQPKLLRRDARLGVPPDDFAVDGQDWGLPWFDFEAMEVEQYQWLKFRAVQAAGYYDLRRVDHAVGYFRQYLRDEKTPRGRFVPDLEPAQAALGEKNFRLLSSAAPPPPGLPSAIIAEDLGVIPKFVRGVLDALQLPGYKVMRWAREDGVYQNPHEYPAVSLVTTGTHDSETLREWWQVSAPWEREAVCRVFPELSVFQPPPAEFTPELHEALLRAALNSTSGLCVLPWQDVYGEAERVNLPGTVSDANWTYRMKPEAEELGSREDTARTALWLKRLTAEGRRSTGE